MRDTPMVFVGPRTGPRVIKACVCGHPRNLHAPSSRHAKPTWRYRCYVRGCDCPDYTHASSDAGN